jgi:hypothetical protein
MNGSKFIRKAGIENRLLPGRSGKGDSPGNFHKKQNQGQLAKEPKVNNLIIGLTSRFSRAITRPTQSHWGWPGRTRTKSASKYKKTIADFVLTNRAWVILTQAEGEAEDG